MGYNILNSYLMNDGSVILTVEKEIPYVPNVTNFAYGKLLVMSIDEEGISWTKIIEKVQPTSSGLEYYSTFTYSDGDHVHLLYNMRDEEPKSLLTSTQTSVLFNKPKKAVHATVDLDGKVTEQEFKITDGKRDYYIIPSNCKEVRPGEIMLWATSNKHFKIGFVEF